MNIVRPCYLCTCSVNKPLQMPPICQRCASELSRLDPVDRMNISLHVAKLRQSEEFGVSLKLVEGALIKSFDSVGKPETPSKN